MFLYLTVTFTQVAIKEWGLPYKEAVKFCTDVHRINDYMVHFHAFEYQAVVMKSPNGKTLRATVDGQDVYISVPDDHYSWEMNGESMKILLEKANPDRLVAWWMNPGAKPGALVTLANR